MNTDRFRAKALTVWGNPEWVEGYYVGRHQDVIVVVSGRELWAEINPDTLCQCTGLKDKEDNLIYERDEVVVKGFRPHPAAEYDPLAGVFDEYQDLQGFVEYRNGRYYICSGQSEPFDLFGFQSTEITLTGKNIHDVPNK